MRRRVVGVVAAGALAVAPVLADQRPARPPTVTLRPVVVLAPGPTAAERGLAGSRQSPPSARRDSIWNGVLVGAAAGAGAGLGVGAAWYHGSGRYGAKPPGYRREFLSGTALVGAVIGAIVGWRLDARRP